MSRSQSPLAKSTWIPGSNFSKPGFQVDMGMDIKRGKFHENG
jgi:hypothetical protein